MPKTEEPTHDRAEVVLKAKSRVQSTNLLLCDATFYRILTQTEQQKVLVCVFNFLRQGLAQ